MYYFLYFRHEYIVEKRDNRQHNILFKSKYVLEDTFSNKTDVACVAFHSSGLSDQSPNLYTVSAILE